MITKVTDYFENTVIPKIQAGFPEIDAVMSLQVEGSCGLGVSDEYSDLEASLYLEDTLWKSRGGHLQILLNDLLQETCPFRLEGSVISVSPLSWLLGGHAGPILSGELDPPWDDLSHEDLFSLHENLVIRDEPGVFERLRAATSPDRFPGWAWKRRLILQLKALFSEDLPELESSVKRDRNLEANILLGKVVEGFLQLGFTINRAYTPWRSHLRWGFEKLPDVSPQALPLLDSAVSSPGWSGKIDSIHALFSLYLDTIFERGLLPELDVRSPHLGSELEWAERLEAWKNPNWRDWIVQCEKKATKAGKKGSWWVWSLWKWDT